MTSGTVAVYGASGYTGRQVARELVRRGVRTIVAGRTHAKLATLADELGGEVGIRTAALDDPAGLRALVAEADLVVNCAGPFTRTARPVVEAALAAGRHYLDISAEQLSARWVYEQDARARAAGIALLPTAAVFGGPAALAAAVALGPGSTPRDVEVVWSVKGWRPSWTTVAARLEGMRSEWYTWDGGRPVSRRGWPATEWFEFPTLGRRRVGVYPTPDAFAVAKATGAERVRTLMTTATISPLGPLLPPLANAASRLLRSPARPLVERALAASWRSTGEDGKTSDPTPFTIVVRADGELVATVSGVGIYDLTAPIAAEAAVRVLDDGFSATGALALAEAFDPADLLAAIERQGVHYELAAGPSARRERSEAIR